MPDTAQDGPRERLLAAVLEHIRRARPEEEISLRALAAATGTSHRMLVYHFGSREGLLIEVVRRFEAEQCGRMRALLADETRPLLARLQEMWRDFADPAAGPRERLFFEVFAYALQGRDDTRSFLPELVEAWLAPLAELAERVGVDPTERRAAAGVLLAVTRGLLMSLVATGNLREVEAAMQHFLANYAPLQRLAGAAG